MNKKKRIVGGHEERFPRPIIGHRLLEGFLKLGALPRDKAEGSPIWRVDNNAKGISVPFAETGKAPEVSYKNCEVMRRWYMKHIHHQLGVQNHEVMIVAEYDPEDPDCDPNGNVIRFYRTYYPTPTKEGVAALS